MLSKINKQKPINRKNITDITPKKSLEGKKKNPYYSNTITPNSVLFINYSSFTLLEHLPQNGDLLISLQREQASLLLEPGP